MNDTLPSTQADISQALEHLFRELIRVATTSTPRPRDYRMLWTEQLQDLRAILVGAEPGADLGAAFQSAVTKLLTYEPQSALIEAQIDMGRFGMRHLIELASSEPVAKSRLTSSEMELRGALAWLDTVRDSSSPVTKPAQTSPVPVPNPLTVEQAKAESDLAMEIAVLFREAMRSMSANDRRGPLNQVLFSYNACKNLAGRIDHSYYFDPILQLAIDQFNVPAGLTELDAGRLNLARAGVRLLATRTDPDKRRGGYASRVARDTKNFDYMLNWFNAMKESEISGS